MSWYSGILRGSENKLNVYPHKELTFQEKNLVKNSEKHFC